MCCMIGEALKREARIVFSNGQSPRSTEWWSIFATSNTSQTLRSGNFAGPCTYTSWVSSQSYADNECAEIAGAPKNDSSIITRHLIQYLNSSGSWEQSTILTVLRNVLRMCEYPSLASGERFSSPVIYLDEVNHQEFLIASKRGHQNRDPALRASCQFRQKLPSSWFSDVLKGFSDRHIVRWCQISGANQIFTCTGWNWNKSWQLKRQRDICYVHFRQRLPHHIFVCCKNTKYMYVYIHTRLYLCRFVPISMTLN